MSEARPFDAIVGQILAGSAPRQVRLAAARGALPLSRAALVRLYLKLREEQDEEIRVLAEASLGGLETAAIREVLSDDECAPEVLDHFAGRALRDTSLAERIAFHRAVPVGALATLAGQGGGDIIDLVLTNQQRLLREPELLERLTKNPALRADQRGRILELLDRASRVRSRADAGDESVATDEPELSPDVAEAARLLDIDVGELFAASEILGGEELELSEDPDVRSAYKRILMLNTAQKAILAMRGGREERMILVRDTNRVVAVAVLRNGRITEEDIEAIARMRSVSNDVLREIAQNRDWTKKYAVIQALVNNPKTPQGLSTNFISRLQSQHLKQMMGNHEVPELVRRMARRTIDTRAQRTSGIGAKKGNR